MKKIFLVVLAVFAFQMVQAQEKATPVKKEKIKMVMIKKTIDENGNEVVEKIIKEGDEARDFIWIEEGEDGEAKDIRIKIKEGEMEIEEEFEIEIEGEETVKIRSMDKTIDVDMEEENGHRTIKIAEGENGEVEVKVIKLDKGEEIPADIQKKLNELGIDLNELRMDEENKGKVKIIQKEKTIIDKKKAY